MRRPLLAILPLLAACTSEPDVVTGGFDESVIDRNVRHGQGLRAVDMDGDGNLELVAALSLTDAVQLYLPPQGKLTDAWERISVSGPGRIVAMDVTVDDMDGDGDLDIAAVGLFQRDVGLESPGEVVWYENPGDLRGVWLTHRVLVPVYQEDQDAYAGGLYGARTIRSGDLDGDGDVDLVVGALESVARRFALLPPDAICTELPALGNGVYWFSNLGDGRFEGPFAVDPALAGVSQVVVADMDADDRLDVVATAATSQQVVWYRNTTSADGPRFVRYVLQAAGGQYFGLEAANMDADPQLELVVAQVRGSGAWVHTLDPPADLTLRWNTSTVAAGVAGLECTTDADCPRLADNCASVQGACTPAAGTSTVATGPTDQCTPAEICGNGEDEDGNGLSDCEDPACALLPACGAECPDPVMQCVNNPAGQTEAVLCEDSEACPRVIDVCTAGFCPAVAQNPVVAVGDFSGDGLADVVVGEATGELRLYTRDGAGWQRRDIRKGYVGITFLGVGDVDGDDRLDFFSSTYEFGSRDRLAWWRNVGN
ncbi:MAG: VCBS repeat-containing protein [Deltaproteobacteria bacterium]|nr:VCBS repeat-containing protein [Deltaproteobacteria bacterium]